MPELVVSFRGMDADEGRISALAGIESAVGLARVFTLVGHYAATGTVRRRFPFDDGVQFFLEGTEEGSFKWKFTVVAGTVALGLTTSGIYDLIKLVGAKAIGEEPTSLSQDVSLLNETKSGDIDALVEAIEPALKAAHYGIGETIDEIVLEEKSTSRVIIRFDSSSKRYLSASVNGEVQAQDVSISALNVNDRTGRAYFLDLARTIPFSISKEAEAGTIPTLSAGLDGYANQHEAPISIEFERIESADGRLKSIIILGAENIVDEG